MTTRTVKLLAATAALAAFMCLSTDLAGAKGGSGWHGGGRGGGFGGARIGHGNFGGARIGNFSGARMGSMRAANFSGARMGMRTANFSGMRMGHWRANKFSGGRMNALRTANLNGKWTSRNRFASLNGTRMHGFNSARALGGGAWNKWGNHHWRGAWNGRWAGWGRWGGGWFGPVFWPFFYGDLFAFVFWPYGFYDPFWAYGDVFVWDSILWPGPAYVSSPAYYDVYGGYGGYARSARTSVARNSARDITGSIPDSKDLAQTCAGLAPGVTDLPMDRIEKTIDLTDEQLRALDLLKAATAKASETLKASCSSEVSLTPLGRLEAVQKRLDGMTQAMGVVRAPLDNFYNLLNEEQKQRFAALGPTSSARAGRRGSGSGDNLAQLCSRQTEGFTQLPVQRIEQTVKPTQQQQDAFDKLKVASIMAADQLKSSCAADIPQTPLDRFDAVAKRLDAMAAAIKIVHPALSNFYLSLTDEQKARFNILAPSKTTMNREG